MGAKTDTLANCGVLAYRYISILEIDYNDEKMYKDLKNSPFSPSSLDISFNTQFMMSENASYRSETMLKWSECSSLAITRYMALVNEKAK